MFQKMEVIGRLGRKPEMKFTPAGAMVTSFSVATDNKYTNAAGEAVKETVWFRVQVWGKMAEACNTYLDKGSLVFVSGRMVADKVTGAPKIFNKADGTPSTSFEINAREVKFLSTKSEQSAPNNAEINVPEDDVPF